MPRLSPSVLARSFFLLLSALFLLGGCEGSLGSAQGPAGGQADGPGDGSTTDDDDSNEPGELDCADGLDDDEDQLIDCQDPDCAEVFHCTWPGSVNLHTRVQFLANELAESFGVGDCTIEFGGVLTLDETAPSCPGCDRQFSGAVSVSSGDCSEDYIEPPVEAQYGFVFLDETEREVWKFDFDEEAWESLGIVVSNGATWQAEQDSPVLYDVPIFGETEVGTFNILATLTDL